MVVEMSAEDFLLLDFGDGERREIHSVRKYWGSGDQGVAAHADIMRLWKLYKTHPKYHEVIRTALNTPTIFFDENASDRPQVYNESAYPLWRGIIYALIYVIERLDRTEYLCDLIGVINLVEAGKMPHPSLCTLRRHIYRLLVIDQVCNKYAVANKCMYRGFDNLTIMQALAAAPRTTRDLASVEDAISHVQACGVVGGGVISNTMRHVFRTPEGTATELVLPSVEQVLEYISRDYGIGELLETLYPSMSSGPKSTTAYFAI